MEPIAYRVPHAIFVPICLGAFALVLTATASAWWLLALPFVVLGSISAAPNHNLADGFMAMVAAAVGAVVLFFHEPAGSSVVMGSLSSWFFSSIEKRVRAVPVDAGR